MKALLLTVWTLLIVVFSPMWHGYVLSIIWGWFIAPTFGVASLSVPAAIGLSAAVRFLTWQETDSKNEEKTTDARMVAITTRAVALPAFTLLFCWIVKHWM